MSGKRYVGTRTRKHSGPCVSVAVVEEDHSSHPLDDGFEFVRHSPTGFEWGYNGSGPAQLAFAILHDHFGDPKPARDLYQLFKAKVIAALPHDSWELTTAEIDEALAEWMGGDLCTA